VRKLVKVKAELEEGESPILRQIFGFLFPFGPAWNSSESYRVKRV
jgi:zinc transporter 7